MGFRFFSFIPFFRFFPALRGVRTVYPLTMIRGVFRRKVVIFAAGSFGELGRSRKDSLCIPLVSEYLRLAGRWL